MNFRRSIGSMFHFKMEEEPWEKDDRQTNSNQYSSSNEGDVTAGPTVSNFNSLMTAGYIWVNLMFGVIISLAAIVLDKLV